LNLCPTLLNPFSSPLAVILQLKKISGVTRVIVSSDAAFDHGLPEVYSPVIVALQNANKFSHVLAVSSAFGKNVLPRVSALLDVAQISDVVSITNSETFVRPLYAGDYFYISYSASSSSSLTFVIFTPFWVIAGCLRKRHCHRHDH